MTNTSILSILCAGLDTKELRGLLYEKDPERLHQHATGILMELEKFKRAGLDRAEGAINIITYLFNVANFWETRATYLMLEKLHSVVDNELPKKREFEPEPSMKEILEAATF